MASVAQLTVLISAKDEASAALDAVGKKIDATAQQASRGKDLLAKGAIGLGSAMVAGFGAGIFAAANFESAMSGVQAATNATGDTFTALRKEALRIGKDTKFSATEAAGAIEILGKAGMSTENILAGGAKAATDMAAAVGEDLGLAAETTTGVINAFNLSGEAIPLVADEVTRAVNASTMGLEQYNAGMRNLSPTLASFSHDQDESIQNFKDGNIALEMFTNRQIKAADAGMSLTRAITNLAQGSDKGRAAMDEYGVSISAFDAEGKFVGLPALFEQVKVATEGMTDANKEKFLSDIFGAEAIDVMTIASEGGIEAFNKQKAAHDAAAGAAESAAIRMDNLKGALENLRGSAETALIAIGTPFLGALKMMAQGLNALVGLFLGLPGPIQAAMGALLGIGGALAFAAGGLVLFAPHILAVRTALASIGGVSKVLGLLRLGPLAALAPWLALGAAIAGIGILAYKENWLGFGDAMRKVGGILKWFGGVALDAFKFVGSAALAPFKKFGDRALDTFRRLRTQGINPVTAALSGFADGLRSIMGDNTPQFLVNLAAGAEHLGERIGWMKTQFDLARDSGQGLASSALAALRSEFPELAGAIDAVTPAVERVEGAFKRLGDQVPWLITSYHLFRNSGLNPLQAGLAALRQEIPELNGVLNVMGTVVDGVTAAFGKFRDAAGFVGGAISDIGGALLSGDFGRAWDLFKAKVDSAWTAIKAIPWGELGGAILDGLQSASNALLGWGQSAYDAIATSVGNIDWGGIASTAGDLLSGALDGIGQGIDWVLDVAVPTLGGWITYAAMWLGNQIQTLIGEVVPRLANWVLDVAVPKLVGWITYAATWLGNQIQTLIGTVIPRLANWVLDVAVPTLSGWITYASTWVQNQIQTFVRSVVPRLTDWVLDVAVPKLVGWITYAAMWVQNQIQTLIGGEFTIPPILVTISDWIVDAVTDLWDRANAFIESQIGGGGGTSINSGAAAISSGGYHIPPIAVKIQDWIIKEGVPLWDRVETFINDLVTIDAAALPGIQEKGRVIGEEVANLLITGIQGGMNSGFASGFGGEQTGPGGEGLGGGMTTTIDAGVQAFIDGVFQGIRTSVHSKLEGTTLDAFMQGEWGTFVEGLWQNVKDSFMDQPPVAEILVPLMAWWDGVIAQIEAFGAQASARFTDALIPLARGLAEGWNSTLAKLPDEFGFEEIDTSPWMTSAERYTTGAADAFERGMLTLPPKVTSAVEAQAPIITESIGGAFATLEDDVTSRVQSSAETMFDVAFTSIADLGAITAAATQAGTQAGTEVTVSFGDSAGGAIEAATPAAVAFIRQSGTQLGQSSAEGAFVEMGTAWANANMNQAIGPVLPATGAVMAEIGSLVASADTGAARTGGSTLGGLSAGAMSTGLGAGFGGAPTVAIPEVATKVNDITTTSLAAADPTAAASAAAALLGIKIDAGMATGLGALEFQMVGAALGLALSNALRVAITNAISQTEQTGPGGEGLGSGLGQQIATSIAASVAAADFSVVNVALQTALTAALSGGGGEQTGPGGAGLGGGGFGATIGTQIATSIAAGLTAAAGLVTAAGQAIVTALMSTFVNGAAPATSAGTSVGMGFSNGLAATLGSVLASAQGLVTNTVSTMVNGTGPATSAGTSVGSGFAAGLEGSTGAVMGAAQGLVINTVSTMVNGTGPATSAGSSVGVGFSSGIASAGGSVEGAAAGLVAIATSAMASGAGAAQSAGYSLGAGFANGISSMEGAVSAAAGRLAAIANAAIASVARIFSPSKVTRGYGRYMGEGLELGLTDSASAVAAAGGRLASSVMGALGAMPQPAYAGAGFGPPTPAGRGGTSGGGTTTINYYVTGTFSSGEDWDRFFEEKADQRDRSLARN